MMTEGSRTRVTIKNTTHTTKNKTYGTQEIRTKRMITGKSIKQSMKKQSATQRTSHHRTVMIRMRMTRATMSDIGNMTPCRTWMCSYRH